MTSLPLLQRWGHKAGRAGLLICCLQSALAASWCLLLSLILLEPLAMQVWQRQPKPEREVKLTKCVAVSST